MTYAKQNNDGVAEQMARRLVSAYACAMQTHLAVFHDLTTARAPALNAEHGLDIKAGEGLGAAILKVMKPAWTTDSPDELLNTNGLFFSVWVDADCAAQRIARYNLHAKKLRFIKGEAFAAREFVRSFREQSKDALAEWPNCTFPKGPITLFEGHFRLSAKTLHSETSTLIDRFAKLTPVLDRLLAL